MLDCVLSTYQPSGIALFLDVVSLLNGKISQLSQTEMTVLFLLIHFSAILTYTFFCYPYLGN